MTLLHSYLKTDFTVLIRLLVCAFAVLCLLLVRANANPSELTELSEILTIMQDHLVNRDSVSWPEVNSHARAMLAHENDTEGKYRAIHYLLAQANTNHSFYRSHNPKRFIFPRTFSCQQDINPMPKVPKNIGYIKVPGYQSGSPQQNRAFAEKLKQQIVAQDSAELDGWIVDLQHNRGGNMWPMLAGLSALLGEGTHGHFIKPSGETIAWGTNKTGSVLKQRQLSHLAKAYQLKSVGKPIAVLSSKLTASSGEAVLIALQGLEHSKSFGQHSCGQSTANRVFTLQSGNQLTLTVSYMADERKRRFGGPIEVDKVSNTPVLDAIDWIQSQ